MYPTTPPATITLISQQLRLRKHSFELPKPIFPSFFPAQNLSSVILKIQLAEAGKFYQIGSQLRDNGLGWIFAELKNETTFSITLTRATSILLNPSVWSHWSTWQMFYYFCSKHELHSSNDVNYHSGVSLFPLCSISQFWEVRSPRIWLPLGSICERYLTRSQE